jgi:hypothetical protein
MNRRWMLAVVALAAVCTALLVNAHGQDKERKIILADDFESGNFDRWDRDGEINPKVIAITTDPQLVHSGKRAVEITAAVGEGTGGKLVKWFMPGHDKVHARWYCMFAEDFDQGNHMHFVHMLANRADDKWSAFGKAGLKPNGDDFFTTGLEPDRSWGKNPPPGEMFFYSYFPDMKIDPKMNKYWGNAFRPDEKFLIERGRWYCMEMMVKANTDGKSDGEQAFWIDGKLIGHFKDIRWRTTDKLKVNCFWLLLYVHDSKRVNKVYFDDVVISTEYIGPLPKKVQGPWGATKDGVKARLLADEDELKEGEKAALSLELQNTSSKPVVIPEGASVEMVFEKTGETTTVIAIENTSRTVIEPKESCDLSIPEATGGKMLLKQGSWRVSAVLKPPDGAGEEGEAKPLASELRTGVLRLKVGKPEENKE